MGSGDVIYITLRKLVTLVTIFRDVITRNVTWELPSRAERDLRTELNLTELSSTLELP